MLRVLPSVRARHITRYFRNLTPPLFLREFVSRPAGVGAICPSSRTLAQYMARQVPATPDGLVVELGAGTGVVTEALLRSGIAASNLLVVELSPSFVQRLRKRFPQVNVIQGNAAQLETLIPENRRVNAIVSSLPLCSIEPETTREILKQWHSLLHPGGVAVQFSYHLRSPAWRNHMPPARLKSKIVWANLPPANVSTFHFDSKPLS